MMRLTSFGTLILIVFFSTCAFSADTSRGLAFIVGNNAYAEQPLEFAAADAREIEKALGQLDYETDAHYDVDLKTFKEALESFKTKASRRNVPVVFYFAGHGFQINGVNYLLPIDVNFKVLKDIVSQTMSLDAVFDMFRSVGGAPKLLVLDACRFNPLATYAPNDWIGGFAPPTNAPPNTLIAYATEPGSVAADGTGPLSPYTASLATHIRIPGLTVEQVFNKVREDVFARTGGRQIPWVSTSLLTRDLRFRDPAFVTAQITAADDDVTLFINGDTVIEWASDAAHAKRIQLNAGLNKAELKVYNQRSYTDGIPGLGGHKPEGWRYAIAIKNGQGQSLVTLSDAENEPSDNGPRHGKWFTVARFDILVDALTGAVTVGNLDRRVWQR